MASSRETNVLPANLLTTESTENTGFDAIRTLLEDFDDISGLVLIARGNADSIAPSLQAALLAQMMGLKSIDHAKRTYIDGHPVERERGAHERAALSYIAAYQASKRYVFAALAKLETSGKRDPTVGEFAASVALERLPHSLFCAHLLYRLGHRYEGHAVSRHILEQIGWAYAAAPHKQVAAIKSIQTTNTISTLKKFYPDAGRLYGFLSKKTHINYSNHLEFVHARDGRNAFLASQPRFVEYAEVILALADIFGAVWEASQFHFVRAPEATVLEDGAPVLLGQRPFATAMRASLDAVVNTASDATPSSATEPPKRGAKRGTPNTKPRPK